ncbi:CLOCK-interacting pacemaker [Osmerus eperlanus]|uniref:CLOCK-interacting pacemaker n=1 Tax=Osmerus eperlanus TaxID=29151 RepID=UPI002E0ED41C
MSTNRRAEGHSRPTGKSRSMKSGSVKRDSERDSGFSDASSEHMGTLDPTDSEGSSRWRAKRASQRPGSGSGSKPSQLAQVAGSYPNLSPMIIMNNVVLKQPGDNPPALKPWSFPPAMEVVQPVVQQSQVVFLQPVVSNQSPSVPKEGSGKRRRPKKYLPILKSYPKIAPHPTGDNSSGRGSLSSSSSSGSTRSHSLASSHRQRHHRDKQRRLPGSGSSTPSLPATPSSCLSPSPQSRLTVSLTDSSAGSSPAKELPPPAVSRSEFTPSPPITPSNHTSNPITQDPCFLGDNYKHDLDGDNSDTEGQKRKRFCNTYNILSKTGLLDITLRTKELIRQNRRTQSDLDRLKADTSLFVQALKTGDPSICAKLQTSLQEMESDKNGEKENGRNALNGLESFHA